MGIYPEASIGKVGDKLSSGGDRRRRRILLAAAARSDEPETQEDDSRGSEANCTMTSAACPGEMRSVLMQRS